MPRKSVVLAVLITLSIPGLAWCQKSSCDRACLNDFVDLYLTAMMSHDPSKLPHTETVKFTENGVVLKIGDGMWATADKIRDYKIDFVDGVSGNVGVYGVVEEDGNPALLAARMKVMNRKVTELETVVARKNRPTDTFPNADKLIDRPAFHEDLAPGEGSSRKKMVQIANSYFETLQQNDGTIKAPFDPNCNRVENGVQTTNNTALTSGSGNAGPSLGCEAQFKTGNFRFVTRIRDRRFPVVDERKGLVLASTFFDHAGNMRTVALNNGKTAQIGAPFDRPYSFIICELFKIKNGKILQIEAVIQTVPYDMPSVWRDQVKPIATLISPGGSGQ